jgi:hypothetical protein
MAHDVVSQLMRGRVSLQGRMHPDVDHDAGCLLLPLVHPEESFQGLEEQP